MVFLLGVWGWVGRGGVKDAVVVGPWAVAVTALPGARLGSGGGGESSMRKRTVSDVGTFDACAWWEEAQENAREEVVSCCCCGRERRPTLY